MGAGTWSDAAYKAASTTRAAAGVSDFDYSDSGASTTHTALMPDLDGKGADRESRDSDEHPNSVAIAVLEDVTGSMQAVPRQLQKKLPQLLGLLMRKGYVTDPQILFGAIGDATCDRAPLQIGQFESDNRMDEDLGRLLLEGGGGGSQHESYELALYYMARHTQTDCWDKRGHKGYLFIIGDEMAYDMVNPRQVRQFIGDEIGEPIPFDVILAELLDRYEVYYILPAGASYVGDDKTLGFWRARLGQRVIELGDLDAAAETIALTIGLNEGTVDLDGGLADLGDVGSSAGTVVGRALARLGDVPRGGVVAAPPPGDLDAPSGNERL